MDQKNHIENLQRLGKRHLWLPYTQMKDYHDRDLLLIDHAQGIFLYDKTGIPYYDTVSSWWCIVHGHGHPTIQEHIRKQLHRLDHVLLAGVTHEPAIELACKLVELTPERLTRVFYSDNGSTACEVALKMSLQYWLLNGKPNKKTFVALDRGYHGDTIGTMSLGGVPGFHGAFENLFYHSFRVPSPYCYRCPMGQKKNQCSLQCIEPLRRLLQEKGNEIAALIMEPLIQAAGGMVIYPKAYLAAAASLAKEFDIHLILDEVATGFGRTGTMFAMEHAGVAPDFLCISKGLTAGFLPMAATLSTEEIFMAFYADYKENKTFYHGHTYTGNPLATAAALGSLQVFQQETTLSGLRETVPYLHGKMQPFAHLPYVGDLRQLGMISAIELVKDKEAKTPFAFEQRIGWKIYLKGLEKGLLLRPLGNVIYLWLPLCTTKEQIDDITNRTWEVLTEAENTLA